MSGLAQIAGARILVLNWRDVRHPQAGGAETYMHEIAKRWAAAGARVTWCTARAAGQPASELIDGVRIVRAGGELSLYARAAARLVRSRGRFDAVVDCQNGIPFFAPLFAGSAMPVVQVVHHVHQDQFALRFPPPVAAAGRFLEGPVSRRVYGPRAVAAVSPSTRLEVRRRLGLRGPIFVVPNGTVAVPSMSGPRDPDPTVVLVSRLVPHKRIDLLLGEVAGVARRIPRLRVEIVGDGPERARLQELVLDLGLQHTVTLHGFLPGADRDALMSRAWLTTSTSVSEGWGCSVIEAAAWGVPCLALRVPGIRDSVLDGATGWLVARPGDVGSAMVDALTELADEGRAAEVTAACQEWAGCFSWDRSAELLAAVVAEETGRVAARAAGGHERRYARADIGTIAHFSTRDHDELRAGLRAGLRATDQISDDDGTTTVLLEGCDEADASALLRRHGVFDASLRLVDRLDLITGPAGVPRVARSGSGPE